MAAPGQESESLNIQLLVDSIPALIHTARPDGYLDYFNKRWLEYLGVTLGDVTGWKWSAFVHPEDVEGIVAKWRACLATGEIFEGETRVRAADGEYRWMFQRKVPLRDGRGDIVKWYGSSIDIEERKTAEEQLLRNAQELRRSEFYLAEGQRLAQMGSWAFDPDGFNYWSPELFRMHGLDPASKVPSVQQYLDCIHPQDREFVANLIKRILAEASPFDATKRIVGTDGEVRYIRCDGAIRDKADLEIDYRFVHPDKGVRDIHTVCHAVLDRSGDLSEFVGTVIDITERKRAEDDLRQAFEDIRKLKEQLYRENLALRDEVDQASMFEEIVGTSKPLKAVLSRIGKVASTEATVLITGETGTGKELIARALHKRSQRSGRAFVSVNCAAIPRDLIASELFGNEKGAFTGATQRRLGRFELADSGTVFLDEVGELSPDTQVALLRVLQEREFERVGGGQPIQVDVRVIAATNRDLNEAVASGTFRQDLFYRLNVFPIEMPPLRDRKDDILMLVEYFVQRYATKAGKDIRSIDRKTLDLLQSYDWPGNIRELQNVIERSIILSSGEVFSVDELWLSKETARPASRVEASAPYKVKVEPRSEQEIIEAALAETRGRVWGPSGAAAKLGIPPSTLAHRIKALKIDKIQFKFR